MTVRRGFLNWGIFLIALGLVPLAVQLGWIPRETATDLLRLWPLILIGIGLGLLLRLTPYAAIGGVVVAATLGTLVGVVIVGGFPSGSVACSGDASNNPPTVQSGTFTGTTANVNLELTCADIDIVRAPGGAWSVDVAADANDSPVISSTSSSLTLRSDTATGFVPFAGDASERWHLTLPSESALSANMTFNAASAHLAIGNGPLDSFNATYNASDGTLDLTGDTSARTRLDATLNASSLDLIMPAVPVSGDMTLNAASMEMCTALGSAVRIVLDETLSSNNFGAAGLVANGKAWESPGFSVAASQLELHISANVSSITLNPSGGCK